MKIALFGARANNAGLGNQTKEFFDHFKPVSTVVMDLSHIDGKEVYPERFTGKDVITHKGFPSNQWVQKWVNDHVGKVDLIFCIEIPYNYHLFSYARMKGIKTVLQYNYEFLDYLQTPTLPLPDMLLAPSLWNLEEVENKFGHLTTVTHLPVPTNTKVIKNRLISECKTFIHVAGYKLFEDRNGTHALLNALPYIKSQDIKLIIYSQHPIVQEVNDPRVEVRQLNLKNYWDLYEEGDCLILPRRYGGLSLQCNEAMAAGMPVIMPNCDPNYYWVAPACLFQHSGMKKIKTRTEIECYQIHPPKLAAKIDEFASAPPKAIQAVSEFHTDFIRQMSFDKLTDRYLFEFNQLCDFPTS